MIKAETIGLFIAVVSFFITIASIVNKISTTVSNLKSSQRQSDAEVKRDLAAMRTELRELIAKVQHDFEVRSLQMSNFDDKLMLGVNNAANVANHVRQRTLKDSRVINRRVTDLEQFLAKGGEFEVRR